MLQRSKRLRALTSGSSQKTRSYTLSLFQLIAINLRNKKLFEGTIAAALCVQIVTYSRECYVRHCCESQICGSRRMLIVIARTYVHIRTDTHCQPRGLSPELRSRTRKEKQDPGFGLANVYSNGVNVAATVTSATGAHNSREWRLASRVKKISGVALMSQGRCDAAIADT